MGKNEYMSNSTKGEDKFKEGYNCAQAVLFSLTQHTGLSEDDSLKIATGFGAGMGRTQHVCGAVSGGIMALNLLYGRGCHEGKEAQEEAYVKVQSLIARFEEESETIVCRELLDGCDLLTEEGQARFGSENMAERCSGYVASVINIVEGIIARDSQ
jgi:C_GCAxxG_C_C family probable redox protein